MKHSMAHAWVLAAALSALAAARSLAQERGAVEAAAAAERREIEGLEARIARLEEALRAARAAPAAPSTPAASPATVSTAAAREAGAKARAGAGDAAAVKLLLDLFRRREAPALTRELGTILSRGEPSRATLYDFLAELDRDSKQALLLSYDYRFSFSLVHLVMLHEEELAQLAHYFLAASETHPRSTLRRTLFDYLPELLRYHRGRYPDLERHLEKEIIGKLKEGKGDLQMYYRAMESLGYKPPIEVFDPLLEAASSHAETLPVVLHLEARNNSAAAGILRRNISTNPPGRDWKASIMLGSLARMSAPEAGQALSSFASAADGSLRGAAVLAYVSVPRDETSLPMLEDFLVSDVDLQQKRLVVLRLQRGNPGLFEALKADSGRLGSEEVQKLLAEDQQGTAPPAR